MLLIPITSDEVARTGKMLTRYARGTNISGTNTVGFRLSTYMNNGSLMIYITRISIEMSALFNPGTSALVSVSRISGGTATATTIFSGTRKDFENPAVTIATITGGTGTIANQPLVIMGGRPVTGSELGLPRFVWEAYDLADRILLRPTEGIAFQLATAGDVDNRYDMNIDWEEA